MKSSGISKYQMPLYMRQEGLKGKNRKMFGKLKDAIGVHVPEGNGFHVGMRVVKTGVAIFLTALLYNYIDRGTASLFLALVAAIVSMQDTTRNSIYFGMQRLIGTCIGGVFGIFFVLLVYIIPANLNLVINALFIAVGAMIVIVICSRLGLKQATTMALVVLLAILLNEKLRGSFEYALNRILDTAIGIVISVIVNISIRRPKWE